MDRAGYQNPGHRFDRFIDPARKRPQIWRILVGFVVIAVVYGAIVAGFLALAWWWLDAAVITLGETPRDLMVVLATFVGMALGPMAAVLALHSRSIGSLFGPAVTVVRDFAVAAAIVFCLILASLGLWSLMFDAMPGLPIATWLSYLPLALVLVVVQTGAEEVLFRGYLQQQLAARFASILVWMVLPSVLFGLAHFNPDEFGQNAWLVVAAITIFGLIAADLTYQSGSIGAAWGFHFANNSIVMLILGTTGPLSGMALFLTPYDTSDPDAIAQLIPIDIGVMLLAWFLVRRYIRTR